MRVVDFWTFPDQEAMRVQLLAAFDGADLQEGTATDPTESEAPFAVGWDDDLTDDELRELAEEIRAHVETAVDGGTVRFQLADGASETAGGSPDHLE